MATLARARIGVPARPVAPVQRVRELPMPEVPGVSVSHRYVEVDGLRVHVAEAGEGPPLLLLHGWPQHWWSWRAVIPALAERHHVICPDIRGLGWTEAPPYGYSFARLSADLVGLLDVLGIDRVDLVGHDWGAGIGTYTCLNRPERVRRYMCLAALQFSSARGAPLSLWLAPRHIYLVNALGTAAVRRLGVAEASLRRWRHRGVFTPAEEVVYAGSVRRPESAVATTRFYRNVTANEVPRYVREGPRLRLEVPTLHLNGAEDPLTRGMPDNMRGADYKLELVPDCGHFIAEERPSFLLRRMGEFFD